MKAVVLEQTGGSDKLVYRDVDKPKLAAGQVLVEIKAAPVNFIDTVIREGQMPPGMMPELPFISGVEASGVVVDANGCDLAVGQKVAYLGPIGASTYAQYAAIDASKLIVLPMTTDLVEAGSMPVTYFTAYHMLHNVAKVKAGQFALVYAASGGVGTALIQLAKLAGIKVIALERQQKKVEHALSIGADFALNSNSDWVAQVNEITAGRGVNYIFNPVAGDTIVQDLAALATLGHIVIFGFLAGLGQTNLQQEVAKHFAKSPTITYSEIYATYFSDFALVKSSLEAVYQLLNEHKIKPIYTTMPLSQATQAHDLIESGKVLGKLLLIPSLDVID